jgi:virginiamycin B lyase
MISEFPLANFNCRLNGITAGPDNAIWFTEDESNHTENGKIVRITSTGKISEFHLPTPGGGPGGISVGSDGTVWFTEMLSDKIGRLV